MLLDHSRESAARSLVPPVQADHEDATYAAKRAAESGLIVATTRAARGVALA